MMKLSFLILLLAPISLAALHAQSTKDTASDIATQPAQDVNAKKIKIPEKLKDIQKKPYSLKNLDSCSALIKEVNELSELLGPDLDEKVDKEASKKRKETAKRVGGSITGSIIPFRGIVREVSGAAKAQRKYNKAVTAGITRRAFLKGVGQERKCAIPARPTSVK